jgi:hypothetical protein
MPAAQRPAAIAEPEVAAAGVAMPVGELGRTLAVTDGDRRLSERGLQHLSGWPCRPAVGTAPASRPTGANGDVVPISVDTASPSTAAPSWPSYGLSTGMLI